MKTVPLYLAVSLFCLATVFPACAVASRCEVASRIDLFESGDLHRWYTWIRGQGRDRDPKKVFTMTADGILHISGEGFGCITTREEFENYRLIVEYRWGEKTWGARKGKARDSGILVHSNGNDGAYSDTWMYAFEVQMIEGGTGDFIVVSDGSGRFSLLAPLKGTSPAVFKNDGLLTTRTSGRIDWFARDPHWQDKKGYRGARDREVPLGQWNRLEVICDGDTITNILNGTVVNQAFKVHPQFGRIQMQTEGAELFVRKAELLPVDPKPGPGHGKRRFIYNNDADNMFIYRPYPMKEKQAYAGIDAIADTRVTTLFLCPNYGMPVVYPTKVGDFVGEHASPELAARLTPETPAGSTERGIMNMRALACAGHDPFGILIDRAREKGLETFVTWRLNEVHAVEQKDSFLFSRFWKEHPEWHIGNPGDPLPPIYQDILGVNTSPIVGTWLPAGLNFAVPEVRAHRLAQLRECCERFPVDGLELDFQRFPIYFKPGEESKNVATMTRFVRKVRALTREIGRKRGRPLQLCARIMARPEQNRAIGLDPVAWAKEGLLDFVTVSQYLRNDYPLPIEQYRTLLPETMPIYGSIEYSDSLNAYRRIARQLWANGVDGIYLFNFFAGSNATRDSFHGLLNVLGDLATAALPKQTGTKSLFLVANKHSDTLSFVDPDTFEILDTVPTGPNPHEMAITPDQRFMYLSNYAPPGNTISVMDLVAHQHIKQIPTGDHLRIHGATMAPDGKNAYFTAGQTGWVVEVDTATHEVSRVIPTHGKISHMVLVSPDNRRIYTANIESENVSVIDRKTGKLITQIPCEKGAEGMAFTPDGKRLWVANQTGGSMSIIDLATNEVVERFDLPGMPVRIKFTRDGKRAYVSSWTPEGELIVLDVPSRKELKRIKVGHYAIGVELTPDEKKIFVGCEHADGVHVVNAETLEVEAIIKTGDGPDPMSIWYPPQ